MSAARADILALFKAADGFGTLGALVNNAGIVGKSGVRVEDMTAERIQEVMAVNVTGAILCAREAVKRMSTKFGGKGGVIVNISSVAAGSARPTPMSTMPPRRPRSTSSPSVSARKSQPKAFASPASVPA